MGRAARGWELTALFPGRDRLESAHFVLHYDASVDAAWAPGVLAAAEAAREAAGRVTGLADVGTGGEPGSRADRGKVTILLYPDYASLGGEFTSRSGFRALGAYWGGVIQVLSPRLWLQPAAADGGAQRVAEEGLLVHEYSHLLLDRSVPGGNYPRWLSEGLAQYAEYRTDGYLWVEPGNFSPVYSLADLNRRFDGLDNPAAAYREAFLLVAYLEDAFGPEKLAALVDALAAGYPFDDALRRSTGLTSAGLEDGWLRWLTQNLPRYSAVPGKEATPG